MVEDDTRGRKRKRHPYHFSSHFAQLVVREKREAEKGEKREGGRVKERYSGISILRHSISLFDLLVGFFCLKYLYFLYNLKISILFQQHLRFNKQNFLTPVKKLLSLTMMI